MIAPLLLSRKRDAGKAIINTLSKTAPSKFTASNEPIGFTLIWYTEVTVRKL